MIGAYPGNGLVTERKCCMAADSIVEIKDYGVLDIQLH